MTELDPLTEPLVRLFLRIDAAHPTDPLLRAAAEFWQTARADRTRPAEADMAELPAEILPHAFIARLTTNGTDQWLIAGAGAGAAGVLHLSGGEVTEKRTAVRLRRLFELVAAKSEPCAAMFEIVEAGKFRQLVEVYVAPLGEGGGPVRAIFAALRARTEALK